MALDVVELVMRSEEAFGISFEEADTSNLNTAGDLYVEICRKLDISPRSNPDEFALVSSWKDGPLGVQTVDQNPDEIWAQLIAIISDQLQIKPEEVRYNSRFGQDLGAD
jgi:acyl carrier protein